VLHNIYRFILTFLVRISLLSYGLSTDCRAFGRKWGSFVSSDSYQAYPAFPAGGPARLIEPPAVQLVAAGPVKQRRLTVAFRLILVIPQIFLLSCLNLAGLVVAFLGWWAALFTGRLPGFAVSYLSGLARWNTRVYGYLYLLTDAYPPFTFDDNPGYPVVIAIPEQGRLNRFAVLFRFVLMVWGNIVVTVLTGGVGTITAFIAWLITLITGKLPAPLHLAFTAVLRYQTRYYCYLSLLTPTYPWQLFGDEPDASAPGPAAPAVAPAASPWDNPPAYGGTPAASPWDNPPAYGGTPGYGTPGGYGSAPAPQPASWPLVLPRSAKNLLIVFIALGLITNAGSQYASAKLRDRVANSIDARTLAISDWNTADNELNANMNHWQTSVQACDQKLSCVTAADGRAAGYLSAFASQVQGIAMPTPATSAAAAKLVTDATRASADFATVSKDTTVAQYQADMASSPLSPDLNDVQAGINSLANVLDNP
jgi:Domain of unknown function (DUF4389)